MRCCFDDRSVSDPNHSRNPRMDVDELSILTSPKKYAVFISFRGEDTRKSFTSHLLKALINNRIETYFDEKLDRGKKISKELINAIDNSKISVVIFSENYASSSWCLDELVHIIQCMKKKTQMVLPVFYHVDPSDVRSQKRSYAVAFEKLNKESYNDATIQKWKDALTEAANLSGWHAINYRNDADLVDEIVQCIRCKFDLVDEIVNDIRGKLISKQSPSHPLKEATEDIQKVLYHISISGILAMDGLGKSSPASVVSTQYRPQLDRHCFLQIDGVAGQKHGATKFCSESSREKDIVLKIMSPLPRFAVFKSKYNCKYLRRISKEESSQTGLPATFVNFTGEDITNPYIKFELEKAKKYPEMVHIRCCHSNKYLTMSQNKWIVAAADHPIEDLGRSCTMFEPIRTTEFNNEEYYRFRHVKSGCYACLWRAAKPHTDGLCAAFPMMDSDNCEVYKVLDWESLVIFPRTVTFKLPRGDKKYLSSRWIESHPYLQFVTNEYVDNTVVNEISTFGDGYIRIKNLSTGKFWRRSSNWIWADSSDTTGENMDTLFWPIKLTDNIVALRNSGNNYFCKSLTMEGKTDCLSSTVPTITDEAKLEVVESVISRSIYNIDFRQEEGRVYNLKAIEKKHAVAENHEEVENIITLMFSYKKSSSSTIGSNISLSLGVKTSIEIEEIPLIADEGKIEISADVTAKVQWGKTEIVDTSSETTYTIKVPPRTRTIVALEAIQGTCDVPFSYIQRDTLYNGNLIIRNMNDGMYTGVNLFDFKFRSRREKLP